MAKFEYLICDLCGWHDEKNTGSYGNEFKFCVDKSCIHKKYDLCGECGNRLGYALLNVICDLENKRKGK